VPFIDGSIVPGDGNRQTGVLEVIYSYRCPTNMKRVMWSAHRPKDSESIRRGAIRTGRSRIRIHSLKLINALRAVVEYYPDQDLLGETVEFRGPFRFIYHHKDKLLQYKDHHPPQHSEEYRNECNEHIDILLAEFEKLQGKKTTKEAERHERGVATFENLWMLFRPGDKVFVKEFEPNQMWSAVLVDISGGAVEGSDKKYSVSVWNVKNFGIRFSRERYTYYIAPFEGERDIMSLQLYPQQYHQDTEEELAKHEGRTLMRQMEV